MPQLNRNLHMLDNSIVADKNFIVPNLVKSQTGQYYYFGGINPNEFNEFVRVHEQSPFSDVGDMPTDYRTRKLHLNSLPWKNNNLAKTECGGISSLAQNNALGARHGSVDLQIHATSSVEQSGVAKRKFSVQNVPPSTRASRNAAQQMTSLTGYKGKLASARNF